MSTGGIFQLITNDGKQDKLLMATELLNRRLATIRKARKAAGLDPTPTLANIEKTHIFFVSAHFKPFTAIASEYIKVQTSGTYDLGQTINYNIPQYGDFFSDMVFHIRIDASQYQSAPKGFSEAALHHSINNNLTSAFNSWNSWSWAPYLGERIIKKAAFTVNGNPLDEYNQFASNVWREFFVPKDKIGAYKRCMGQQDIKDAKEFKTSYIPTGVEYNETLSCVDYTDGLQTYSGGDKDGNDVVDLWIPLLFWFSKDTRLAVPSVAIPYGQRYISLELESIDRLINTRTSWSNTTEQLSAWTDLVGTNPKINAWEKYLHAGSQFSELGDVHPEKIKIETELYINNLFVNPEIHEIFIKRVGFYLIRVHKYQKFTGLDRAEEEILLNGIRWPVESLYLGFQPEIYDYNSYKPNSAHHKYLTNLFLDRWNVYKKAEHHPCSFGEIKRAAVYGFGTPSNISSDGLSGNFTFSSGINLQTGGFHTINNDGNTNYMPYSAITDTLKHKAGILRMHTVTGPKTCSFEVVQGDPMPTSLWTNQSGNRFIIVSHPNAEMISPEANVKKFLQNITGRLSQSVTEAGVMGGNAQEIYLAPTNRDLVDTLSLKVHGITLFENREGTFFQNYTPYRYGPGINGGDSGIYMVNFALYPGAYQPSGHINVSRAREFYLSYRSSVIGTKMLHEKAYIEGDTNNQAVNKSSLNVLASAINFLLIQNGSAVLRYST